MSPQCAYLGLTVQPFASYLCTLPLITPCVQCPLPSDLTSPLLSPPSSHIRNNRLSELCAGLCSLKLSLLDLTNNDLRTLPHQLGLMVSLRSLPLDGNALKQIRRELVAGPISALLQFLQTRLPTTTQQPGGGGGSGGGERAQGGETRSGNMWGVDEAQLASEVARKLSVSVAAEAQDGFAAPMPSRVAYGNNSSNSSNNNNNSSYSSNNNHNSRSSVPVVASPSSFPPGPQQAFGGNNSNSSQSVAPSWSGAAPPQQAGRELSLKGAGLTEVPLDVWQAAGWLTKLDLSGNRIAYLPPQVPGGLGA